MAELLKCDSNRIDIIRVIDLIQRLLADEPQWEVDDLSYKLYCHVCPLKIVDGLYKFNN